MEFSRANFALLRIICVFGIINLLPMYDFGGEIMSKISEEQVRHVANVARIAISDEQAETYAKQLDEIIHEASILDEVNTDNVEPTIHVIHLQNVLREDEVKESLSNEDAMKNAADHEDGQVKVPSVLE